MRLQLFLKCSTATRSEPSVQMLATAAYARTSAAAPHVLGCWRCYWLKATKQAVFTHSASAKQGLVASGQRADLGDRRCQRRPEETHRGCTPALCGTGNQLHLIPGNPRCSFVRSGQTFAGMCSWRAIQSAMRLRRDLQKLCSCGGRQY